MYVMLQCDPTSSSIVFFFLLPFFFPASVCGSHCFTGQSAGTRLARRARKEKSRAQGCVRRWGKSTGGMRVRRGFRQELAPVGGIGVNVVEIWCGFTEKGGCEGGHGCMGQRGGPTCGESGRNALLEDDWRMVGACMALARARLLMKAAVSSLHLPPASIASNTKRQRWLLTRAPFRFFFFLDIPGS